MIKYKAIISDIDGTLTPITPHAYPTEKVTQAIKQISKKGIIFSLASGRPFALVDYLNKHLELSSPTISDNGAVITDAKTGSVLWESLLDYQQALDIAKIIKDQAFFRISTNIERYENTLDIPKDVKIRKISAHDMQLNIADDLIKEVNNKFSNLAIIKAASYKGPRFIDLYVSNSQATKQHAILKYAEILNISTSEIIGIGDGYNDFPLLMACGLKVAMGNAIDDIKAIADYIAPSVENDGVVDILQKFILS